MDITRILEVPAGPPEPLHIQLTDEQRYGLTIGEVAAWGRPCAVQVMEHLTPEAFRLARVGFAQETADAAEAVFALRMLRR